MEEKLVSYNTAVLAKENGFNYKTTKFYISYDERDLGDSETKMSEYFLWDGLCTGIKIIDDIITMTKEDKHFPTIEDYRFDWNHFHNKFLTKNGAYSIENNETGLEEINLPYFIGGEPIDIDLISTPTQSLLQKWLRDTHDIHIEITHWEDNKWSAILVHDKYPVEEDEYEAFGEETYEDALEIGLYEALKLLDDKN